MENKLKHLEFIQAVITRMNSNSFLIKGWCITLVSALFALSAANSNMQYSLITYIAIPLFWGLDAFYLSQEKKYRELYKITARKNANEIDFLMDTDQFKNFRVSWLYCIATKTIFPLYLIMLGIIILIMILFK